MHLYVVCTARGNTLNYTGVWYFIVYCFNPPTCGICLCTYHIIAVNCLTLFAILLSNKVNTLTPSD